MLQQLYCSACSNQLIFSGSYSNESYYICPTCLAEYVVIEEDEATFNLQVELKGEDNFND